MIKAKNVYNRFNRELYLMMEQLFVLETVKDPKQ
jgi:hypothetical protein